MSHYEEFSDLYRDPFEDRQDEIDNYESDDYPPDECDEMEIEDEGSEMEDEGPINPHEEGGD